MPTRNARLAATLLALGLVAAGCSSGVDPLPEVPAFKKAATTTTGPDYSDVGLKGVAGKTTTTVVSFGPGRATISGVVVGDDGQIAGASVAIDRFVGSQVATMMLTTAEDGSWSLPAVLGGRYRVRAWRQPDLAQTSPSAIFLGENETKSVELKVKTIGGMGASSSFAPNPPRIDTDTNLVVLVTQKTVDEHGVARSVPLQATRVDLVGSGAWRVLSANPAFTDDRGRADWTLHCQSSGRQPLAVTVGSQTIPLEVPACVDPGENTTTTMPDATEVTTP